MTTTADTSHNFAITSAKVMLFIGLFVCLLNYLSHLQFMINRAYFFGLAPGRVGSPKENVGNNLCRFFTGQDIWPVTAPKQSREMNSALCVQPSHLFLIQEMTPQENDAAPYMPPL